MATVYLGMGSNLDDPELHLKTALNDIENINDVSILACSSFYKSPPHGPQDQPDYINSVVKLVTGLPAHILLSALHEIEALHGRKRESHWGPRTLDLDILLYDDMTINDEKLVIPHPQMLKRDFVLVPLVEIEPDIEIPGKGPASSLLADLGELTVRRIAVT